MPDVLGKIVPGVGFILNKMFAYELLHCIQPV